MVWNRSGHNKQHQDQARHNADKPRLHWLMDEKDAGNVEAEDAGNEYCKGKPIGDAFEF